jgi:hypothetical protein
VDVRIKYQNVSASDHAIMMNLSKDANDRGLQLEIKVLAVGLRLFSSVGGGAGWGHYIEILSSCRGSSRHKFSDFAGMQLFSGSRIAGIP